MCAREVVLVTVSEQESLLPQMQVYWASPAGEARKADIRKVDTELGLKPTKSGKGDGLMLTLEVQICTHQHAHSRCCTSYSCGHRAMAVY